MMKSDSSMEYKGDELHIFKEAVNWKKYFSGKLKKYIYGDVLEVGAGIGTNAKFLLPGFEAVSSWCFLEPDNKNIREIEINTKNLNIKKKSIVNGTIKDVKSQKFDTIIYIDVLEHIENSEEEVKHAKEILNDGGVLIILVPAFNFLYNDFDANIGHYRRYNKSLLKKELIEIKKIEKLYYLDSLGFIASLLNKLILKKSLPSENNIRFWDGFLLPVSKIVDNIVLNQFGKSLLGIYRK